MSVETPERLITPLKHYEVVIQPDPNRHENGELLSEYALDRIFPILEAHNIEISPSLPKNSPIEQAGFLLHNQMVNFISTVNEGKLEEAITELIVEIRAHANEYPKEAPLFVGSVKKKDGRVVNKYNNEPVTNHLDWAEREGATARGSLDLEEKVLKAGQDESVVLISPSGWNGVYPDYEKTHLVYYRSKEGDNLEQLTFVLNFKLENCIRILERMGIDKTDLVCTESRETTKRVVGQAIPLGLKDPADILNMIKTHKLNDPALGIIERDLERYLKGEDITTLPMECEDFLNQLELFIFQNAGRLEDLKFQVEVSNRIEETIYKIAEYIKGWHPKRANVILGTSPSTSLRVDSARTPESYPFEWRAKYLGIIEDLKRISGCAGGGSSMGSKSIRALGGIFSIGSVYYAGYPSINSEHGEYHVGSCGSCKRHNVIVGECGICTSCEKVIS